MSQAFVKEQEGEWLGDVSPNVVALARFLSRESGTRVQELKSYHSAKHGKTVYEMSNGFCYALDMDNRWYVV
jgi:hypothetical protein